MEFVASLIKIGFTQHEAETYLALCKEGEMTGYETAKLTGIPRSNVYLALSGLVEKGGAYRIEGDPVKYIALPAQELIHNKRSEIEVIFQYLETHIPTREESPDPFITISGQTNIINKMKNIILEAKERIYFSGSIVEVEHILPELTSAFNRGLKVVLITSPDFKATGFTVYHSHKQPGQIRLIADSTTVLTGQISDSDSSCLFSHNKNLVQLIKDSLTNEIKLIELKVEGSK
jgi:sugar-specific transcriptional regulator TrmB